MSAEGTRAGFTHPRARWLFVSVDGEAIYPRSRVIECRRIVDRFVLQRRSSNASHAAASDDA
jgi:hypothetical protein